jgi:hypothetical protein
MGAPARDDERCGVSDIILFAAWAPLMEWASMFGTDRYLDRLPSQPEIGLATIRNVLGKAGRAELSACNQR